MNPTPTIIPDWKWGTAEGSRQLDRILDQKLNLAEKIQWLEEAETLSLTLQAGRGKEAPQGAASSPENSEGSQPLRTGTRKAGPAP